MASNAVLFTPERAAAELGVAVATLADWRYHSKGPPFVKYGNIVRYRAASIEAWIMAHEVAPTDPAKAPDPRSNPPEPNRDQSGRDLDADITDPGDPNDPAS